jgi:hypothetical protein
MPKIDTPATFANAFTRSFAAAVRDAAGSDGRLSTNEAQHVAEPFRDNAVNYLEKVGQKSVAVDKLIGKAHDYAFANAARVAGGPDKKLDEAALRKLPADLLADAAKLAPPSADARAREMKDLAEKVALSAFGEDDTGEFVQFVRRHKKVDTLDADTFLQVFGFSQAKQEASDQFSFAAMTKGDWDMLEGAQYDAAGEAAMKRVREIMEPLDAKVVFLEDDRPFGAPVFVVAKGPEGELFALRATVGGMGF